jgi:hypothetical protein
MNEVRYIWHSDVVTTGRTVLALLATVFLFNIYSCEDSGAGALALCDRSDFVWTIGTLEMPMNSIYSIWGSSPNDVWATGPDGTPLDELWNYDGAKWIP